MINTKLKSLAILVLLSFNLKELVALPSISELVPSIVKTSTSSQDGSKDYNYFFHGEDLQTALNHYAQGVGLELYVSHDINMILTKHVSGQISVAKPDDILDVLASRYGFSWFIYSDKLYISSKSKNSVAKKVQAEDMPSVRTLLSQDGLLASKFGYLEIPSQNSIIISGPQTYVDLVSKKIDQLKLSPVSQQFAVYRLKYASANDVMLNFNNQQITIPGVATILQSLLQGGQNPSSLIGSSGLSAQVAEPVPNNAHNSSDSSAGAAQKQPMAPAPGSLSSPLVQADNRSNSIVIRDKRQNLIVYKNLIETLDVPTPLIQVEVMIIHLDQQNLENAGINWWGTTNNITAAAGISGLNPATSYGNVFPGQLLITNMQTFATSLQFLEQNKYAKTVAKPSLATTDNIPAIINVTENIFLDTPEGIMANVANSAMLSTQITQALQITPHVVYGKNHSREVRLSIVLQDGAIRSQNQNSLPNTVQSTITSQAIIKEGQSIILAGYTRDQKMSVEKKIPVLGDVPVLGWFFKTKRTDVHNVTTVYLVTPKIIHQLDVKSLKEFVSIGNDKINIDKNYKVVTESESGVTATSLPDDILESIPLSINLTSNKHSAFDSSGRWI